MTRLFFILLLTIILTSCSRTNVHQRDRCIGIIFPNTEHHIDGCGLIKYTVYWDCNKIENGDTMPIILRITCPDFIFRKVKPDSIYCLMLIDSIQLRDEKKVYILDY